MSLETRKVLEMLASSQITAADAEKLLEKLGNSSGKGEATATVASTGEASASLGKIRYLRVVVDQPEHDQLNIRVPLGLLRTGMKLLGVIPPKFSEKLAEKGMDLSALRDLKGGELVGELKDLHVDVDSKDGEKVSIFCE